jgi:hypothetical protein
MHTATIYVNPTLPDEIGFAQAAGVPGDVRFYFKDPSGLPYADIVNLNPQLVMRPFTAGSIYGYDIDINDVTGASGIATIPASVMNDRFNIEVYTRNDQLQPQDLLACGRIDLTGYGYMVYGPLAPASYSTGPVGPAGAQGPRGVQGDIGAPGVRGSRWYTGLGAPGPAVPDQRIDGDMWLDESNGDVWRWDDGTRSWGAFRGTST